MDLSRQESWNGLPFPSPEDLPHPGTEPRSPAFQVDSLPSEPQEKPMGKFRRYKNASKPNLYILTCVFPMSRVCSANINLWRHMGWWYIWAHNLICCFIETPNTRFFLQSSVHFQSNIALALIILLNHQAEYSEFSWNLVSSLPFVQNESVQSLTEFCQEIALVIVKTLCQQHKRRLYTRTSPNGQYWNQIDYILCSQRWRSCIQSAKTRPGADCGSDHQLLIAKFRLKLKKVGKTTRPARYDLNLIPHEYSVEVRIDSSD